MHTKVKVISSGKTKITEYLSEIWRYRNLILVFTIQEFKVQYVQTRLNIVWVLLKPIMVLLLFSFIFGKLIRIPGLQYPYPLFAFSGLIVWNNFSFMVNNAGAVIITNQVLVKKIYFPKLILIFSKILVGLIEVTASLILLLLLIIILRYPISLHIFFLPLFIFGGLVSGTAIAIWLNALTVRYRDLNHFVPTLIGFLIWLTPVFYPLTLIPKKYDFIIYLNPIAGAIQGCRWAILGDSFPNMLFLPTFLLSVIILIAGMMIFIRAEDDLVDYI